MNSEKKIEEMKKLRRWILNHNREWEILIGAKKGTRADYDRLIEELETNDFEELQNYRNCFSGKYFSFNTNQRSGINERSGNYMIGYGI